ncbi:MAG: hypothetical protein ACHQNE_03700 [Candidatus Kapaibacterium sp.]
MNNLPYTEFLDKKLEDPAFAVHYLQGYLEDGTPEEIAEALSKIIRARRNSDRPKIYEHLIHENRDALRPSSIA